MEITYGLKLQFLHVVLEGTKSKAGAFLRALYRLCRAACFSGFKLSVSS